MNIYAGFVCPGCGRTAHDADPRPAHKCARCGTWLRPAGYAGTGIDQSKKEIHNNGPVYNNFFRRLFAGILDSLVIAAITTPLYLMSRYATEMGFSVVVNALIICACPAYFAVLHAKYGKTLGKLVFQIKVVDHESFHLISINKALLRVVFPILIAGVLILAQVFLMLLPFMPLDVDMGTHIMIALFVGLSMFVVLASQVIWFLLEAITMLFSSKRRALHDYMAGSVVVRHNKKN